MLSLSAFILAAAIFLTNPPPRMSTDTKLALPSWLSALMAYNQRLRTRCDYHAAAEQLDIFVATSRAGLSLAQACAAVAATTSSAVDAEPWRQVAAMASLGVPMPRACTPLANTEGLVAVVAVMRAADASGASIAAGCERIARSLRDHAVDTYTAQAERTGALIALPLTLCFLPAFFLLGLAPVAISLGMDIL